MYLNSDWSCAQWLFVVLVTSLHLSAPLISAVEFRCEVECVTAQNVAVWPTNGWFVTVIFRARIQYNSTLLQIYLEGRISKKFWILIYFWSVRVQVRWWRVSNLFFLYIFRLSCFSRNQPKATHNDDKIQQVKDNVVFHIF